MRALDIHRFYAHVQNPPPPMAHTATASIQKKQQKNQEKTNMDSEK